MDRGQRKPAALPCAHRRLHPGRAQIVLPATVSFAAGTYCADCGEGVALIETAAASAAGLRAALGPVPGSFDRAMLIGARDILQRVLAGAHVCKREIQILIDNTPELDGAHVDMNECPTPELPDRRDEGCPACRTLTAAPAVRRNFH